MSNKVLEFKTLFSTRNHSTRQQIEKILCQNIVTSDLITRSCFSVIILDRLIGLSQGFIPMHLNTSKMLSIHETLLGLSGMEGMPLNRIKSIDD